MGLFAGVDGAGVVPVAAMGGGAPGALTYTQRVLATGPIAYWVQAETAGVNAADQILPPLQDGIYARNVAVMGTAAGIGDGNTAPMFNGANDVNNVFSATFQGRFNGAEGSVMVWAQVANAGVWVDGTTRDIARFLVSGANYVILDKLGPAPRALRYLYTAGGVTELVELVTTPTDWFNVTITWSAVADEMRAYFNGVQTGLTQAALGVWAGNLLNTQTVIGAATTAPASVWSGNLAHAAVWDRPLTPAEVAALAVV